MAGQQDGAGQQDAAGQQAGAGQHEVLGILQRWFLPIVAGLVGILVGIALFTFVYAGGINYFGHEAATCNQCHAMTDHYESWSRGSHRDVATCQDCHMPHDNFPLWLYAEANNGFWHGLKFTTRDYPENIKIRELNHDITEDACLYCHGDFVHEVNAARASDDTLECTTCHNEVGHQE